MQRKIAARSRQFWERFAPFASPSLLAQRFPPSSGGLSLSGWTQAVGACRAEFRDLPWLELTIGQHVGQLELGDLPEPVYADEVERHVTEPLEPSEAPDAPPVAQQTEESLEINADGTHSSTKLLRMDAEQCKDRRYLLEAHGFDPAEWEIVSARNNVWNVFSKRSDGTGHDISTLYSSRITVRPLVGAFDIEEVLAALRAVKTVKVKRPADGERLLEIQCADMHFGNSALELYLPALDRICEWIRSRSWAEVLLPIGSDLFHCDNFKNTTSNGTLQSSVAWPQAWADALTFWSTVIEHALKQAVVVHGHYIIGNHDESMSWAFCQLLAHKYPQVVFDLDIEERKIHTFGSVAVGLTHGDNTRTRKDLDRIFAAEFPQFAAAAVREVHAGHLHHEVAVDDYGTVTRSLPTKARVDKWHREEGYVGARRRFQVFEFTTEDLADIHYV